MMSVRNFLSVCSIVFTVSPCTLVGEGRRGRTTARGGLQSDDECKMSVCVALYSLVH